MNAVELEYYKSLIRQSLNDLAWDQNAVGTIDRLISMLETLKRLSVAGNVEHFAGLYPELTFTQSVNYVVVKHSSYKLIRAEAIDYRNRLMADGFDNFRVLYADNGYVESFTDSRESKVLDELKTDYGANFVAYRIEANDTYHLKCRQSPWLEEQNALSLADTIKARYPWLWVVVYYGENNSQKVVRK